MKKMIICFTYSTTCFMATYFSISLLVVDWPRYTRKLYFPIILHHMCIIWYRLFRNSYTYINNFFRPIPCINPGSLDCKNYGKISLTNYAEKVQFNSLYGQTIDISSCESQRISHQSNLRYISEES